MPGAGTTILPESELRLSFCKDNCPYFELPSVFTPNQDVWNDTFSADFDVDVSGESAPVIFRCPRFVKRVELLVFNRWGQRVYTFASADGAANPLMWDGTDQNDKEVTDGVYFYEALVQFDVLRASERERRIQGWVHVVR